MVFRIEVRKKLEDKTGILLLQEVKEIVPTGIEKISVIDLYFIKGKIKKGLLEKIAPKIFGDPIKEEVRIGKFSLPGKSIEILYHPGVSDPQEDSIRRTFLDFGLPEIEVRTGKRYLFEISLPEKNWEEIIEKIASEFLYNPLIQHIARKKEKVFHQGREYQFRLEEIPIRRATARELLALSQNRLLALSLSEMRAIQRYYQRIGREPTDIELETFAQTWSEHCKHKTMRGDVIVFEKRGKKVRSFFISDLLGTTIFKVTERLRKPYCLSVFKDNSGVIELNEEYGITFKVETHNHPSALEPYGGAATGIGGVIRDCLGTGKGAKPILNTDVFCFAPPDFPREKVPKGVLHPKRILKGVVAGVRDYGNRMGIPTANGALYFLKDFLTNPLVFCGTLGLIPKDKIEKEISPGDVIILCGARTGRDGIHGVTFASQELSQEISSSVVQIGNPIEEKKLTDAILAARDRNLVKAITDCGGGGLSSAIGELSRDFGCEVDLEKVPLKYRGLNYTEIWISESQERMVLFTAPEKVDEIIKLFREYDCEAVAIGKITGEKKLRLNYRGQRVGEIDMEFLHKGNPRIVRKAEIKIPDSRPKIRDLPPPEDYNEILIRLLSSPNIASKEWGCRQYDFEVQGRTITKPITSDGCVLKPLPDKEIGVVISNGLCPRYGLIDPYWMAASAIDEALRNLVASGGDINKTAILDNFCFGNPENKKVMGEIVRTCLGAYDTALRYKVPFISGKDSLYNEYKVRGKKTSTIPPTLLISALSVIPDITLALTPGFKEEGSPIYIIGETKEEMGGSEYLALFGRLEGKVPRVNPHQGREIFERLFLANRARLLLSLHDCSEGGVAVAVAEMAIFGEIGAEISLLHLPGSEKIKRDDFLLFSESNTRFIAEVKKDKEEEFKRLFASLPIAPIGRVGGEKIVISRRKELISLPIKKISHIWSTSLSSVLH
uniref:Phosphoribosylformylglycinamidine synthase subunit PurL n=1 Tax=candidate division WOR-3 bacterium TaxID=2052148 RepID=A0A7C3YQ45_UNCW3